jgi:uncharacterized phage-associated protein
MVQNHSAMERKSKSLFCERRTAQAAAFLLFKAAGNRLPFLKLMKLLYLAERLSLKRYGEPITGDRLVSMPQGPVLSRTYDHINGALPSCEGGWDDWISRPDGYDIALRDPSVIRSVEEDLLSLSETDLEVLEETWGRFGHWDKWSLVRYTHSKECPEWTDPDGSSIPIEYKVLFEHLGYSEAQADALSSRLEEQKQLNGA